MTDAEMAALLQRAREAMAGAYAPYSRFHVGAALYDAEGRIWTGANVENASYGLTICAERVAVFTAVAAGSRAFTAIAVTGTTDPCPPCGACRQVLYEFAPNLTVILATPSGPRSVALRELLPLGFGPEKLVSE